MDDIEQRTCQDHSHCATCGQLVLGWDCWRDGEGNWYCCADCWVDRHYDEYER